MQTRFTYVSMTNMNKNYYGVELGLDFQDQ